MNENLTIDLDRVSHVDKPQARNSIAAIHEQIEIKCFYEGTATLLIENQRVSVGAGDVVVINPYEFHATVGIGEQRGKYHLFMLPLDFFSGVPELNLHRLYFGEGKKFPTVISADPQIHDILMQVSEEARSGLLANDLMIRSLFMTLFVHVLRKGVVNGEKPASEKTSQHQYSVIEPALRCIRNEYQRALSVDELAASCKVSKTYFCRVFKAVTKKSAMEYLRDFRLQVAEAMLSNTQTSVSEISACCGFESPNYFSRCYKSYYGKTPRQGRNKTEETV